MAQIIKADYVEMFSAKEARQKTERYMESNVRAELEKVYRYITDATLKGYYSVDYIFTNTEVIDSVAHFLTDMGFDVKWFADSDNGIMYSISWESVDEEVEE